MVTPTCVHTTKVELSPIQSNQTHKDAAVTLQLTYNGRRSHAYTPTCVHTNRVELSWVQPSPTRLTKTQQWLCSLLTMAAAAVRTHQHAYTPTESSRVESNPVQPDSQRRGSDSAAYLLWLPRQCVHTNRVESSWVQPSPTRLTKTQQWLCGLLTMAAAAVHTYQQSPVQSSPVQSSHTSLAESKVLMWPASFSSVRLQWSGVMEEMDVEKLIVLVKDHKVIYDSRCEYQNHVLLWWWWCS